MRTTFLNSLSDLARDDQRRVIRALEQLDVDERTPSLRVHRLQGSRAGLWSASASKSLRITFLRLDAGRKLLVDCSQHYGD
jgi:mRNA-degrading endonuclease YafQ of YafQ-DinJ toxin-antitoxin module